MPWGRTVSYIKRDSNLAHGSLHTRARLRVGMVSSQQPQVRAARAVHVYRAPPLPTSRPQVQKVQV